MRGGRKRGNRQTDRLTDTYGTTTVTLAAHVRQGLMTPNSATFRCNHHFRLYFLDILVFSHLRCIYPIHPAFRVVGLGEPVNSAEGSSQPLWISPEVLTMFQFHHVPPLPIRQERHILENKVSQLSFSISGSLYVMLVLRRFQICPVLLWTHCLVLRTCYGHLQI